MVKLKIKNKTIERKVTEQEKEVSLEKGEMVLLVGNHSEACSLGIFEGVKKAPPQIRNQSDLMTFKEDELYSLSFSYPLGNKILTFQRKSLSVGGGYPLNQIKDVISGKYSIAQYLNSEADPKYKGHALEIANFRELGED